MSEQAMWLIGLIVMVALAMAGMLVAMGRYQRQVDDNTSDIENERDERRAADAEIKDMLAKEERSSYKRDSDLVRDLREVERRVTQIEIHDGPHPRTFPIDPKKKEA